MGPLLRVERLCKTFGEYQALADISFGVCEREVLGLIGPNGSGKTTFMECVAGLLPADRGTVSWEDMPVPPSRRKSFMFYLPDATVPYGDQRAIVVLEFFRRAHGASALRLRDLVERLALEPALDKRVDALSKGYRRRLLLTVALLARQPVLFLDEPFDGLDLRQVQQVMALLRDARERGRTFLLSIHQLTDAERICDRFVLLSAGRLIGAGTLAELREKAGIDTGGLEDVFLALT